MEVRQTMAIFNKVIAAGAIVFLAYGNAAAQIPAAEAEQIRVRQQLATMEAILQRAIVSGAELVMAQVRNVVPARPPRLGTARVSGFKLDGYGVVFHVQVPEFELPILYEVLVQENRNRDAAVTLQSLRSAVSGLQGAERAQAQEAIFLLEQQLGAGNLRPTQPRPGSVGAASLVAVPGGRQVPDVDPRVVSDPQDAYTREVKEKLIEAIFQGSQVIALGPEERLAVVARDGVPSNPQFPGDSINSAIWIMSVKGSVLAAYQARSITLEEAKKQVEIREQ